MLIPIYIKKLYANFNYIQVKQNDHMNRPFNVHLTCYALVEYLQQNYLEHWLLFIMNCIFSWSLFFVWFVLNLALRLLFFLATVARIDLNAPKFCVNFVLNCVDKRSFWNASVFNSTFFEPKLLFALS